MEFSRKLAAVDASYIRVHAEMYHGPTPPSVLDHLGIDDGYLGRGSSVYYFFQGKWLQLVGAD